jgi:hypothetical protein
MRNLAQKASGAVVSNPLDARTVPVNTSTPVFPSDIDGSTARREEKRRRKEEKKRLKAERKAAKKARRKERHRHRLDESCLYLFLHEYAQNEIGK